MKKRIESLPPFALAFVVVVIATAAVLLPDLSGTFPGSLPAIHVSAADAVFSAVLAVCWLYATSWAKIQRGRTRWYSAIGRMIQCYGPVAALFALYMAEFHSKLGALQTAAVFLLCMMLCESLTWILSAFSHSASRRTLVLGTGRVATTVWRDLRTGRLPEMSFAGFTSERVDEELCPDIAARYAGTLSELKEIVVQQSIDDLIIATPAAEGLVAAEHAVQVATNLGVRVWTVRQAFGLGYTTGNAETEYIELVADPDLVATTRIVKRSLDVILSMAVLVCCFPVAAATMLREMGRGEGVRFEWQSRVGRRRRVFHIRRIHSSLQVDWLHEWMNKYLLMWNVLRGEMSMVGPRALSPEELAEQDVPESAGRFGIRPGLTGGWVFERCRDSAAASGPGISYAEHWSLLRDIVVLARAMRAFVQRHAVTHAETGAA